MLCFQSGPLVVKAFIRLIYKHKRGGGRGGGAVRVVLCLSNLLYFVLLNLQPKADGAGGQPYLEL